MHPQSVGEIEEELTCDICAMRMWTPYRWVQSTSVHVNGSLTQVQVNGMRSRFLSRLPTELV